MKTQMNLNKKLSVALSALVLIALSSCGKIPSGYQGTFVDQPTGTKLVLSSDEGKFTETTGREISAKADSLAFDSLAQGKAGLYTLPVPGNDKMTELLWIVPDVATRQENSGYVWFNAEILDTRIMNEAKDPVASITAEHCRSGSVMLYAADKTWIHGCGPETVPMTFMRAKQ